MQKSTIDQNIHKDGDGYHIEDQENWDEMLDNSVPNNNEKTHKDRFLETDAGTMKHSIQL